MFVQPGSVYRLRPIAQKLHQGKGFVDIEREAGTTELQEAVYALAP